MQTQKFRRMMRAELGRRIAETRRVIWIVLAGNLIMALFSLWIEQSVIGGLVGRSGGMPAVMCWITILSVAGVMSADISQSRRDGTILQFIDGNFYASMLQNGYAKAAAETIVALPGALFCIALISLMFRPNLAWGDAAWAVAGGAIVGLMLVPLTFALALYARSGSWISLVVTVITFAWIGAGAADTGLLATLSPASLGDAARSGQAIIWIGFWLTLGLVSFTLAVGLLRLVRVDRDILIDG